jgi:hypothetical protein
MGLERVLREAADAVVVAAAAIVVPRIRLRRKNKSAKNRIVLNTSGYRRAIHLFQMRATLKQKRPQRGGRF